MLLHYSCVLLSLMSCLIVLSLMSCLIVLSFMSCLITLALVVFWVRHIPQECTTYSCCSLRWVCTIALGILSPCHVHSHITSVIPFYFNYYFCTCRGVFLSRRAVPLSSIFICSWLTAFDTFVAI